MNPVRIFKFGGASVKDAEAVRNVSSILDLFPDDALIVVVSAMGKTTNALEELHRARYSGSPVEEILEHIHTFHLNICRDLLGSREAAAELMQPLMATLRAAVAAPCSDRYDREYDQVVSLGEWISTSIIHGYLESTGASSQLADARRVVRTDDRFRDARVDWTASALSIAPLREALTPGSRIIIQGFIGAAPDGATTTLGREGSDFTAAIMAYLLDAGDVTIWKDVPGMLNADPKRFPDSVKLDCISFREAIELAYYGASVIHPKTIKPLQNKGIPLYIKSFIDPAAAGTVIQESTERDHLVPSFIIKDNQVLISLSTRDFSFVVEDNLRDIFDTLVQLGVRIHLMENSAISFSMVVDHDPYKQEQLLQAFAGRYAIRYNEGVTLATIRHYHDSTIRRLTEGREILLEQRSRQTVRMVMR
jgi:aspartate kinase